MKIIMIALSLVIVVLVGVRLTLEDFLSVKSGELARLQQENDAWGKQNMALKNQLLTKESYTTIAGEAARMGFVPAQVVYLK